MNWMYVAVAASFVLGWLIGYSNGKNVGTSEAINQQQQMEATRLWTQSLNQYWEVDDDEEE